ncbi:hypothetical protein FQN50_007191 [Emmonsiellopsis sp. PD_5]|nr:hypothetical protein FQN50_007191 [Emmonsiellopsis sp. PD_5]
MSSNQPNPTDKPGPPGQPPDQSTTGPPPGQNPPTNTATKTDNPPPETPSSQPPPATTKSEQPPVTTSSKTEPTKPPEPTPPTTSSTTTSSSSDESTTPEPTKQPNPTTIVTRTETVSTPHTQLPGATTSGPSALPTNGAVKAGSGGLSPGGTIAVAVVVPVVSVALIIIALLFWWKKRKANKLAEEERKQEIEEYRFNPNHDPTLPAVGLPVNYDDASAGRDGRGGGYRGWGTTTSNSRKLSTNLSSGGGINSDTASNPGHPRAVSPIDDSMPYEDDNRPISGDSTTIGPTPPAVGALPVHGGRNNQNIHRGPSNASSAYSAANHSEISDDIPMPGAPHGAQYYDDAAYYNEGTHPQGPYGDNGLQPVIRDVQARRNTRIENPAVYPQQGNAGISQNF